MINQNFYSQSSIINIFYKNMGKKNEKLCILGQSGSGKDHLLRGLIKKGLKYQPKITTRPKRKLEKNGVEYNFINEGEFKSLLDSNKIKVYQKIFTNQDIWYYGIDIQNFEENNVFIMTPHELSTLSKEDREKCFVVYLDIDENIRRERISRRNDNNDSVNRRIESDKKDFENFSDYDLKITDPGFEAETVYELMA